MSKLNDLHELIENVESVRAKDYPDIPKQLIEDIIQKEYEQIDSRSEGFRKVVDAVASHLNNQN